MFILFFFLIVLYLFFLVILNFSLWFFILQILTSFLIIFFILFCFKIIGKKGLFVTTFLFYYLLMEIISDFLVILSYFFNIEFFIFLILFKSSCFPFLFYKNIINLFNLEFIIFRLLLLFYFFYSKITITILLYIIPFSLEIVLSYLFIFFIGFLFFFTVSGSNFLSNSFIFSNVILLIISIFLNFIISFLYIIITLSITYGVLNNRSKYDNINNKSFLLLLLMNGCPFLVFNWVKFYLQVVILDFSYILSIIQIFTSSIFLTYSIYLCIPFSFIRFNFVLYNFLILVFISFLLFSYSDHIMLILSFCTPQFSSILSGVFSMDFYLIYGESISISISLLFFISYMFFKSFTFRNFFKIIGINSYNSLLSSSYIVNFKSFSFSLNYFDSFIFIFPYSLIVMSTSNFIFLVENIGFLYYKDVMVLVFIISFQWSWDIKIFLSNNWEFYLNIIYSGDLFNSSSCFNLYLLFLTSFLNSKISLSEYNYFSIINNSLFLPDRVCLFVQGISLDVIHALYVPALSIKEDLVKDKLFSFIFDLVNLDCNYLEFYCFEYCGDFHHSMNGFFYIYRPEIFSLFKR